MPQCPDGQCSLTNMHMWELVALEQGWWAVGLEKRYGTGRDNAYKDRTDPTWSARMQQPRED